MNQQTLFSYVVISPVKDEAKHIGNTLESMVRQTMKPLKWVIVDDDSKDDTVQIVKSFSDRYGWIHLLLNKRGAERKTGSAEALAFNLGCDLVREQPYDYIVKLDGDLQLPEDYFEKLLNEFQKEKRLGIASGIYLEQHGNEWQPVEMPDYHAAGASKVIRRECFEQIGGFITTPGWDTVAEIRAMSLGWQTAHFKNIRFHHLKNEGSAMGYLKMNFMQGGIFYLTGGSMRFFILKCLHRFLFGRPAILGGLAMAAGYSKKYFMRKPLLVTAAEGELYRHLLNERISWRKRSATNIDHRVEEDVRNLRNL